MNLFQDSAVKNENLTMTQIIKSRNKTTHQLRFLVSVLGFVEIEEDGKIGSGKEVGEQNKEV